MSPEPVGTEKVRLHHNQDVLQGQSALTPQLMPRRNTSLCAFQKRKKDVLKVTYDTKRRVDLEKKEEVAGFYCKGAAPPFSHVVSYVLAVVAVVVVFVCKATLSIHSLSS